MLQRFSLSLLEMPWLKKKSSIKVAELVNCDKCHLVKIRIGDSFEKRLELSEVEEEV